jgi:ABC-type transport system substrate-binding protein
VGANYPRYINPEWDALVDRFYTTILKAERNQVLRQILHHMTDRVIVLGIIYEATSNLSTHRLEGFTSGRPGWNAHEWNLK